MSESTMPLQLSAGVPTYAALRDRLRAEILSGKIPAGARLTTASLVKRFGISQMPVREALQALQGEGLITIAPHRGAGVQLFDAKRVRNVYDLRGALESLLIRLAVPNLTNRAMAKLGAIHQQIRERVDAEDFGEVFDFNREFHNLIYRHADNDEALQSYDRYAQLLGTLRAHFGFSRTRMQKMVEEHALIMDALQAQDEDRLDRLARSHMEGAKADLLARMAEAPPVPARRGGR
jgi:DNA-binding GntR family transcriptional regulator